MGYTYINQNCICNDLHAADAVTIKMQLNFRTVKAFHLTQAEQKLKPQTPASTTQAAFQKNCRISPSKRNEQLTELLETVYASTAVGHMLSGKAISRAVRGHFLTQTALTLLITSEIYDFPQYTPGTDTDDPSQSYLDDKENFPKADTTCVDNEKPSESNQILPSEIEQLITVFEGIIQSNISIESLNDNPTINIISERIRLFRKSLKNCRTASLWFQY
ncbi:Hypothetical predicted protein [Mytilus galloprovincialis]|uniref:Uncharacterized protein n=1 Tax=Mytilus galloprovincialis TaxID=29158 RepID=A0A8B6GDU7_MYTGA|nr:Hypothetical predicted protein [Mytilus galloprovincialis]